MVRVLMRIGAVGADQGMGSVSIIKASGGNTAAEIAEAIQPWSFSEATLPLKRESCGLSETTGIIALSSRPCVSIE